MDQGNPIEADVRGLDARIVGLGGVGSIVARYLAVFLGHRGRHGDNPEDSSITLIDGDHFEEKNEERMAFSILGEKSQVVARDVSSFVGESMCSLHHTNAYVGEENAPQLMPEGSVIFLCVDNHKTRKIVSDHCRKLRDVCLISGGNDGVGMAQGVYRRGTWGNVQVHLRVDGEDVTPPIDAFHPEIANPQDMTPQEVIDKLACGDAIAAGVPQVIFTNIATASAMLNAFFLYASGELSYAEACFDVANATAATVEIPWGE